MPLSAAFSQARRLLDPLFAMRGALRRFYGRSWPLAVFRSLRRSRKLIRSTRWAGRKDEESRFVRALAFFPALYFDACDRDAARALDLVREMMAAVLEAQHARLTRRARLSEMADPSARWHAFFGRAALEGLDAYNENECLSVEAERFHLRVQRCLSAELAEETGAPELGRLLCDVRARFCARLLPSHEFGRAGSSRHTLAHGHTCCEYVWERPDSEALARPLIVADPSLRRERAATAVRDSDARQPSQECP
jgi:hypothetical protein